MHKPIIAARAFLFVFLQILFVTYAHCHGIECKDRQCNKINQYSYLFPWETYYFSRADCKPSEWKMFVIGKHGNPIEVKNTNKAEQMNTHLADTVFKWSRFKRFYNDRADTCYYKSFITSVVEDYADTVYFKLAFTPSKPIIKELSLSYDGYDYEFHILENPKLSCTLYCPDADVIGVYYTSFFESAVDSDHIFNIECRLETKPEDGQFLIKDLDCDANQEICFYGYNKYGYSINSDTIFTNYFIKDPNILSDLDIAASIIFPANKASNYWKIYLKSLVITSENIENIEVSDITGKTFYNIRHPHIGDKINLKKGIWIVKVETGYNCILKKILL